MKKRRLDYFGRHTMPYGLDRELELDTGLFFEMRCAQPYVQFAPFALRDTSWDSERERLGDVATRTIARFAPGFEQSILARQVITPLDLERTYGLTGGQIFHGELALDQLFIARPILGWSRYRTPIRHLFLCGNGTHPGIGLNGLAGMLAAREIISMGRDLSHHRL